MIVRTFKGIRSDLKLSIDEMAKKIGISSKNYIDKEKGDLVFTVPDLIKLNDITGISFNDLVDMIKNKQY